MELSVALQLLEAMAKMWGPYGEQDRNRSIDLT